MAEKLIFPIGFDLEDGVKQVEKDWTNVQKRLQKTIDKNPLKLDLKLSSKDLDISGLNEYIKKAKEAAQASKEVANARSAAALAAQRESRARVQLGTEQAQIRQKNAQAELSEIRLTRAKNEGTAATNRQNKAYGTQLTYIQRLMQRLAIVSSLYQAIGFVTRIREVTAEFELQRVALGSIIKDSYEASKMFEQITAAAVKSPFQIRDLVGYTKQLAAYKIETKDLFSTTEKLADISAGLGVGMERLVLAFGQIRATGYLRASEVRQLTESGIPIIEELAKKISDMRGELVSAGDVMQMISDRAISFGMVKEVFDDMTSAGGTFYKMQEKQAETLAGQWSNLIDTLAIMYDEIGRSSFVQGLLQGFIDSTKTLASNWQTVRNVLIAVGGLYAGFKIHALLTSNLAARTMALARANSRLEDALKNEVEALKTGNKAYIDNAKALVRQERLMVWASKGTTKLSRAFRTLWATIAANPIGAVITAVMLLGSILYSAWENATKLNRELNKIGSEGALQADQQVRNFERLVKAINKNTVGSKKHNDALQELKRTYGELLPARDQDILALVKEKDATDAVTRAIREKIAVQMKEQRLSLVTSEYAGKIEEASSMLRKTLTSSLQISKEEANLIMSSIQNAIAEGELPDISKELSIEDFERFKATLMSIFKDLNMDIKPFLKLFSIDLFKGRLHTYINTYSEYYAKMQDVSEEMENQTALTGKLKDEWDNLQKRIADFKPTAAEHSFEYNEAKSQQALDEYKKFIIDNLGKGANLEFFISTGIDTNALEDAIKDLPAQTKRAIRMAAEEYDKLVPSSDLQKLIKKKWQDIAKTTGASMTKLQNYYKKDEESTEDWVKGLQDALKERENSIAELKKTQGLEGYEDNTERIKELESEAKAFKLMIKHFREFTKEYQKSQLKDTRLSDLKKQISDITNAYKKFIDLRKHMSKENALVNIATLFPSLGNFEPTYENMVARLEKMRDEVRAKLAKSPTDKTLIDMSRELEKSLADIKFGSLKTGLEQKLARLSDDVAKTKTAKEFYDRMLGLTGDRELSATFTMSVYGESGDDLAKRTVEQLKTAFDGIDLSDAINENNYQIDWNKVTKIYKEHQGDMLEANRKTAEELIKNAQKASAEQILQWAKELEQVKTYAQKRTELARQTAERIREIEQSNLSKEEKEELKKQYQQREEKQAKVLQFESLKESPAYAAMFDNLDYASTALLQNLRDKLADYQEAWQGLDPTQLNELQARLDALDTKIAARNPFKALAKSIKDYYATSKNGSPRSAEKNLEKALAKQVKARLDYEKALKKQRDAQKKYDDLLKSSGEADPQVESAKEQVKLANELVAAEKKKLEVADDEVTKTSKLAEMWKKIKKGGIGAVTEIDSMTQDIGGLLTDIYEVFGGGDEADAEYFGTIVGGFQNISKASKDLLQSVMSLDLMGIFINVFNIFKSVGSILNAGDVKRANKQLARLAETIENLQRAYNNLNREISKSLGGEYVENYYSRLANLQAQQQAYMQQAIAENSKGKDKAKEKVKEYEKAAYDVGEQIKELEGELQNYFLGTDLTSAAREFAQSWIDAYKSYGNTLDAIEQKTAEMIENVIVESLAAEVMRTALKPLYQSIEDYTKDMTGIDIQEAAALASQAKSVTIYADSALMNLMEALKQAGLDVRNTAGGLTGISKDIASASEESILGLAAGINTQNFYISQIYANVANIAQWVTSGGMSTQGVNVTDLITIQNQHLAYLPNIAANTAGTLAECRAILNETRRVADNLDRVIKPKSASSTFVVKTALN